MDKLQQHKMLKMLPQLISEYEKLISECEGEGNAQKLFNYCVAQKYPRAYNRCACFTADASVSDYMYRKLKYGNVGEGIVSWMTLLKVCAGLQLEYNKSFLLLWFNGYNLITDDPKLKVMDEELRYIDSISSKRAEKLTERQTVIEVSEHILEKLKIDIL